MQVIKKKITAYQSTCTKIDMTSLGEGNTAIIVAASLRTVSSQPKENMFKEKLQRTPTPAIV